MTLTDFILLGVAPFVFLVFFLGHGAIMINKLPEARGYQMKKKILKAVFGLGGAFIVIGFWTQLAGQT